MFRIAEEILKQYQGWFKPDPNAGWTLLSQCNAPPWQNVLYDYTIYYNNNPPLPPGFVCIGAQAHVPQPPIIKARGRVDYQAYQVAPPINSRTGILRIWGRPDPIDPWGPPPTRPIPLPAIQPRPNIHPYFLPIKKPAARPVPIPRWLLPRRQPDPLDLSEWGNTDPRDRFDPESRAPVADAPPYLDVDYFNRNQDEHPWVAAAPHALRPPRRRENEKKFQGSSAAQRTVLTAVARVKEGITEYRDFLEVVIESLPDDKQKVAKKGKFATLPEMSAHVYKHWRDIDGYKLLEGFVKMQLEDLAAAAALDAADKASSKFEQRSNLKIRGAAAQGAMQASGAAFKWFWGS